MCAYRDSAKPNTISLSRKKKPQKEEYQWDDEMKREKKTHEKILFAQPCMHVPLT